MNWRIRKAELKDFTAIYSLIKEFVIFQKSQGKLEISLDEMKKNKDDFRALVVELDTGQIIGYACYYFAYYSWSGKSLFLDDLYIQPTYRGKGIGKNLLDNIIRLAKEKNGKKVRWQVSKWNSNAIRFYQKIGAEIDDSEINCILNL